MRANSSAAAFNCWPSLSHCHKYVVAKKTYDCDEHLLLSSMLYSSLTAKGAAGALLDEAGVASVRSFQTEAGKGAGGAASASLNKVLVEVVGVVLVTKNGLHASDELIVVVVIKKGFAVVTVCEASAEAVEAAATAGAVARVAEDTLLDLVVDATNACQTGPRTFGTTAAAAAATAIVVSLVSKVCKTRFLPPCSCLPACLPICLSEAVASTTSQYGHSNSNKESKPRIKYVKSGFEVQDMFKIRAVTI